MRVRTKYVGWSLGCTALVTLGSGTTWDVTQHWPATIHTANVLNLGWFGIARELVLGSGWLKGTLVVLFLAALAAFLAWLGEQLSEPRPRLHH